MRHRGLCILGVLLLSLCHAPAHAQAPDREVEKGLSEFQDLEFAQAIATLEAVVNAADASPSQRILALELIGISHLSLGQSQKAEAAFERLFTLRPEYELRNHDGSPKVSAVFEAVQRRLKSASTQEKPAKQTLALSWRPLPEATAGKRLTILVDATGRAPTSARVFWRVAETRDYSVVQMRRYKGTQWRARLRLPRSQDDYEIEIFAKAYGPAGEGIGSLGDEQTTARHPVSGRGVAPRTEDGAWYGSWKLWAGIGAATLLGGSVALLSSGSDLREGSLSPGRITLSP